MVWIVWVAVLAGGVALIVWGAESFAENLGRASTRLGVGAFALALLLAGAEPEELATVIVASLRGAPGVAFGDIIGANVAACLVAVPVGALMVSLPLTRRVFLYAVAAVPVSVLGVVFIWDGNLSRAEGATMLALYAAYVGAIWFFERQPPALGEVGELAEAEEELGRLPAGTRRQRVGVELLVVIAGLTAMAVGSVMLVEAVRQITNVEETQTRLGLTVVGFATSFELVMLVWSAARRGATDVALAGVVGSFGYNMTMSLGAGAVIRPLVIADAATLRAPALIMLLALGVVLAVIAFPTRLLERTAGVVALGAYIAFVGFVALR